jgi:hypothetical protein
MKIKARCNDDRLEEVVGIMRAVVELMTSHEIKGGCASHS